MSDCALKGSPLVRDSGLEKDATALGCKRSLTIDRYLRQVRARDGSAGLRPLSEIRQEAAILLEAFGAEVVAQSPGGNLGKDE